MKIVKTKIESAASGCFRRRERKPWIPIQERVEHSLSRLSTLFQDWKILVEQGQFNLGLEDIDLAALPCAAELRVCNLKKLLEQINLLEEGEC